MNIDSLSMVMYNTLRKLEKERRPMIDREVIAY